MMLLFPTRQIDMRRSHTAVLLACALTSPGLAQIQWEADFATAMTKSKESGKPVLAYFTFDT